MSDLIVGIDLGTTNSEIAAFTGGQVRVLGPGDTRMLPSCVGFSSAGELLVGEAARNQQALYARTRGVGAPRAGRAPAEGRDHRARLLFGCATERHTLRRMQLLPHTNRYQSTTRTATRHENASRRPHILQKQILRLQPKLLLGLLRLTSSRREKKSS
jgi:hypothetical protein